MKQPRYLGGKGAGNPVGKFVADALPRDYNTIYIEPFAGMLGVLLQRPPVANEIVNDDNELIHNWLTQVRDNPDELSRLIANTPHSRKEFQVACDGLNGGKLSPVRRALATHIVIYQSLMHAIDPRQNWVPLYSNIQSIEKWTGEEVEPLAKRLHKVQLENRDALDILERVVNKENAVIYCDPPYRNTATRAYGKDTIDWTRMAELLKAQAGKVAIRGYGAEWDALGWCRHAFPRKVRAFYRNKSTCEKQTRTEVVWFNYTIGNKQSTLDL